MSTAPNITENFNKQLMQSQAGLSGTSSAELYMHIGVLDPEQLLILYSLYGQEGIDEYNRYEKLDFPPEKVQANLGHFIDIDNDEGQKTNVKEMLAKYYSDYIAEKERMEELTEAAKKATQAKNSFKKSFKSNIATFTRDLEKIVPETSQKLLKAKKQKRDNQLAYEKRQKVREQGIIAYLKGVRAAVIDNCDEDYIKRANELAKDTADEVKKVVQRAYDGYKANPDVVPHPKSSLGTDYIYKATKLTTEDREKIQKDYTKNKS